MRELAIYGYVRVSDVTQNEGRQLTAMNELCISEDRIYSDKQSGKDFDRPAYKALLKKLKPADLIYIKSIDRLGRNYDEIQNQWRMITKERGVDIAVIDMPLLDTRLHKDLIGTFISDIVLQILSFVSQSERETIRKRQAEGIAAAQARGVRFGRPGKALPDNFDELVKQWERRQISTAQILKLCDVSRSTFYAKRKEYKLLHRPK